MSAATTNPIGEGTVNTALNMSREERQLLGRFAAANDTSLNQTVLTLVQRGLESIDPKLAAEIEQVRKQRGIEIRLKAASMIALVATLSLFCQDKIQARVRTVRPKSRFESAEICFS